MEPISFSNESEKSSNADFTADEHLWTDMNVGYSRKQRLVRSDSTVEVSTEMKEGWRNSSGKGKDWR